MIRKQFPSDPGSTVFLDNFQQYCTIYDEFDESSDLYEANV